jgi:D-hexose-6-phosphate mutarotase
MCKSALNNCLLAYASPTSKNDLASASISLFGGQVLTWQPKQAKDPVLWMSRLAKFDAKTAIRGGVPICWPWFGRHPGAATAPSHGYARLCAWELDRITALGDGRTEVVMSMPQSARSGDHRLADLGLSARVLVGDSLEVALTTHNKSAASVRVTEGFHTYFHVSDIADVQVTGLSDCEYIDLIDNDRRRRQTGGHRICWRVGPRLRQLRQNMCH